MFWAKSMPKETIKGHTGELIEEFNTLMKCYGHCFTDKEKELFLLACEKHDLGKMNMIFQEIMNGDYTHRSLQIPHGFLSGAFWNLEDLQSRFTPDEIKALVTAVHYHHDREDSYQPKEYREYINAYIKDSLKKYMAENGGDLELYGTRYLKKRLFQNSSSAPNKYVDENAYRIYVLIKGILNKLDYAASAHEKAEIKGDKKLSEAIRTRFEKLLPAQQFMLENRYENLVVIAPTGSGKTEAGLLWIGDEKGFYTLPLKVSSNDIFDRIHDTYEYTLAGLLHSGSIYLYLDKSSRNEEIDALVEYREVKRLSRPLTVCTVDQLFKFVFKAIGTEIFAATLKYSKIVIDEMQMYEPRIIAMLIYGVKMITDMGGKFAIITATLPPFIPEIMREREIPFRQQSFLQVKNSCRHIVSYTQGDFDFEKIAHDAETKKVLVICNTVKKAQEVKEKLKSARLLHARFIEKHRRVLEKDIIAFGRGKESGIWISTQIVEASLDIDFDVLYTEMCSADSLLQRLGRCYRSRNYAGDGPNIHVYNNGNQFSIYDDVIFERSVEFLNKYIGRIFSEKEKQDYINAVFETEAIKESKYFKTIIEYIQAFKDLPVNSYSKKEAELLFRNINSYRVIPEGIYQIHREEIERQIHTISDKHGEIKAKLQAQKELTDLTVVIGAGTADTKFKDLQPIPGTDIYRTTAIYEFNENACDGRGLLREEAAGSLWL